MNIYISNLPTTITVPEVKELFSSYGTVRDVQLLQDKHTGMFNGSAYLVMDLQDEAERAIAALDGSDYKGDRLHVQQADAADFPTNEFW